MHWLENQVESLDSKLQVYKAELNQLKKRFGGNTGGDKKRPRLE
ncbi:hypothetical protein PI125_g18289 [Phytophthora idaei]|nr:hypothetical protein PI125_g18289 [Phytophthora idaei]